MVVPPLLLPPAAAVPVACPSKFDPVMPDEVSLLFWPVGWSRSQWNLAVQAAEILASNNGSDEESEEHHKHDEVQDSVTNDSTLAQSGLFQRIDGRSNLTTADAVSRNREKK